METLTPEETSLIRRLRGLKQGTHLMSITIGQAGLFLITLYASGKTEFLKREGARDK